MVMTFFGAEIMLSAPKTTWFPFSALTTRPSGGPYQKNRGDPLATDDCWHSDRSVLPDGIRICGHFSRPGVALPVGQQHRFDIRGACCGVGNLPDYSRGGGRDSSTPMGFGGHSAGR